MPSSRSINSALAVVLGAFAFAGASNADIGSFFGKSTEVIGSYQVSVGWQMTRARFDRHGNASDSESFQELWKLEILSDGRAFLATHRQRVPVTLEQDPSRPASRLAKPAAVVVSRSDMALLLGVHSLLESAGVPPIQKIIGEAVRLTIGDAKATQPIAFDGPSDEHVAVRLSVGELQTF